MDPADRFVTLINAPEPAPHLDVLCGLMCEAFDPRASVGGVCAELDRLTDGATPTFEGVMSALFMTGLFTGDVEDYHAVDNSLLHRVLERRTGMPITLSVVAIEVARRLGVPIYGVGLPGHFVVRDATREVYADPFGGGVLLDRAELETMWRQRTGGGALQPAMLTPVGARAIVLRILNNLRASLGPDPDPHLGATLARLRSGFPELAGEQDEHRRLMRHFN